MKILVLNSEIKAADLIKRSLEEVEYFVSVVNDGIEGLKLALSGTYNLVIVDQQLSPKDGLSIVQDLRNAGNHVPVIMISSDATTEGIVSGLAAGADDYLPKPFVIVEFMARVRALLRRSYKVRSAMVCFADLRLDPVSHSVWRDGIELDLTIKEYDLLEYMMRNPNTVLSRNMIGNKIWNDKVDFFSNIIDVYVNYLRNKVDKNFPVKLIHTVRGGGYMLQQPLK